MKRKTYKRKIEMITATQKQEFYPTVLIKKYIMMVYFLWVFTQQTYFCSLDSQYKNQKSQNYEFYKTAQEALLTFCRLCIRCRSVSHPNQLSDPNLVERLEADRVDSWKDVAFEEFSVGTSTTRPKFEKTLWSDVSGICKRA